METELFQDGGQIKREKDIYHHGPKHIQIICHLPHPPSFSLPATFKELMGMLRVGINSWRICSVWASVPDPYAQHAHNSWSIHIRKTNFLITFKVIVIETN
jgi:hypothetical protein